VTALLRDAPAPPVPIYDACVLYGDQLRHLLIELAAAGIVHARWTDRIEAEWTANLIRNRPDLESRVARVGDAMRRAVVNATVTGYERHLEAIRLVATGDRHVLAAAIEAKASVIVTANVKHFPERELRSHGIKAMHPDPFVVSLIQRDPRGVSDAAERPRARLRHPAMTWTEYVVSLGKARLADAAGELDRHREK
jgi:hypothetical protein